MAAAKGKRIRKKDEEGGIAYILKALNGFQAYFSSAPTPSLINVSKKLDLLKLNDHVYELCKPSGCPSVEIVFFHGFQLGGSRQTYATTWLSRNGSELWPKWIRKSISEVRILLVSYDDFVTKKDDRGDTNMYVTSENLVQSLTSNVAHFGHDGCPVILVGHSLGGLVIKEILLQVNKVLNLDKPENPNLRVQSFLENVKQLFYYSYPHNGTRLADDKRVPQKGQLFKLLRTLNKKAATRNEEFCKLRDKFKWGAYSIAEKLPADLLSGLEIFQLTLVFFRYDLHAREIFWDHLGSKLLLKRHQPGMILRAITQLMLITSVYATLRLILTQVIPR